MAVSWCEGDGGFEIYASGRGRDERMEVRLSLFFFVRVLRLRSCALVLWLDWVSWLYWLAVGVRDHASVMAVRCLCWAGQSAVFSCEPVTTDDACDR